MRSSLLGAVAFVILFVHTPVWGAPAYSSESMQDAMEAFLDERYDDAIQLFQQVLKEDKKNSIAQKGLVGAQKRKQAALKKQRDQVKPSLQAAMRHMAREEWVESSDRLRAVLRQEPENGKANSLQKTLYRRVTKLYAGAKPNTSDWFYLKGVLSYLDGDYFQAANTWEQVYTFNPDLISLVEYTDRARQHLEAQQRAEKIDTLQDTAWQALQAGRYEEAIKSWSDLLKIDKANLTAQEGIRQAQDGLAKALVKRRQEEAQNWSQQAMDFYLDGDNAKAAALWQKVLSVDPNNTVAKDYLPRAKGKKSRDYTFSSTSLDPSPASPDEGNEDYQRAQDFVKEERYLEAIELLERHVRERPSDDRAASLLRDTRQTQNDTADKLYREGLELYAQGDTAAAVRHWQDVLKLHPEFQKARQALIKAMAEMRKS